MARGLLLLLFLIITTELHAQQVTVDKDVYHGGALLVNISGGTESSRYVVDWQDLKLTIAPDCIEGRCGQRLILPTAYGKTGGFDLSVAFVDSTNKKARFIRRVVYVADKNYAVQKLSVEPKYVSPSSENIQRAAIERKQVVLALNSYTRERFWELPLTPPVEAVITGHYGVRRIFNGEPRSKHTGTDFGATRGTAVKSIADGVVVLADEHYFAGNSVFVDHGLGLVSMYFHLSEISVKKGDWLEAGDAVGKVGATGRVTGPHLHFGIAAQGVLVDAESLLNIKE